MLQDDYILRQIREMVRAVMKMLFQVSASELTPDVIEDKEARQTLEALTSLADEGNIDEAEPPESGDRTSFLLCAEWKR